MNATPVGTGALAGHKLRCCPGCPKVVQNSQR